MLASEFRYFAVKRIDCGTRAHSNNYFPRVDYCRRTSVAVCLLHLQRYRKFQESRAQRKCLVCVERSLGDSAVCRFNLWTGTYKILFDVT